MPSLPLVKRSQDHSSAKGYTTAQVAEHSTPDDLWVIFDGEVFCITDFLKDHPGGQDVLVQNGGTNISAIFYDGQTSHMHTDFARRLLEKYRIGTLVDDACQLEKSWLAKTGSPKACSDFLDLDKPLLAQMWKKKFTKKYYLEQIHIPRHLGHPARLFHNWILELLTLTPWWLVPLVWVPVASTGFYICLAELSLSIGILLYFVGLFLWTVFEYSFHRFLFHIDTLLPDMQAAFTVHFLIHGFHHFLPMDRYRLVMPPVLFFTLASVTLTIFHYLVPFYPLCALGSGTISGYIMYDLLHYYFHHGRPITAYSRVMKTYHLDHHYFSSKSGFGVSNMLWDVVFRTTFRKRPQ